MLKTIKFFISVAFLFLVACCNNSAPKIKAEKGAIDIITNIYFEASKSLDSVNSYHITKLNYHTNSIVELVPDLDIPQIINNVYYIKDSVFLNMGTVEDAKKIIVSSNKNKWSSVYEKENGAVFFKGLIPGYNKRKNITDTVLFKKKYIRFEIKDKNNFSRFYVHKSDTIYPYSLNKQIDNDYNGCLERVDSYNKEKDIFVTVQLLFRKKMDEEAKDIFDFNSFANKKRYK